jgi:SAM-dependent methyltransferase
MDTEDLELLFDLYEDTPRQGPGSAATTRCALELLPDDLRVERVIDLGCGTGGSTLVLAEDTGAHVTALDIHPPFLETLRTHAAERGLAERITTACGDMSDVAPLGAGYDLVWAEGSAYSIGFENALRLWRPLFRPGGCLVLTELVWFTPEPSDRARAYFESEYPDMQEEATRTGQAKELGYEVLHTFRLPSSDWRAYYDGIEPSLRARIERRGEHPVYTASIRERETFEACGDEYGYLCLVLRFER